MRTLIQPGDSPFEYRIRIPEDQPPGLYWYHPHVHGFTEPQVLGGASGALIVEGIERVRPRVAGPSGTGADSAGSEGGGHGEAGEDAGPGKDISLNFVPVLFPLYFPAEMPVRPRRREFWRVLNAAADTYFDLQLRFGPNIHDVPTPQPLDLVARDGVPVGAGASKAGHILLAPGARAEFIVTTPPLGVFAQLVTLEYDTGPDGAATPYRVIANIRSRRDAAAPADVIPAVSGAPPEPFRWTSFVHSRAATPVVFLGGSDRSGASKVFYYCGRPDAAGLSHGFQGARYRRRPRLCRGLDHREPRA